MSDSVELRSNIVQARQAARESAAGFINRAAQAMKEKAIERAPEDTGYLKEHVEVTQEATAEKPEAAVESGATYSGPVNFGHHTPSGGFVAADPFFTSAREEVKSEYGLTEG